QSVRNVSRQQTRPVGWHEETCLCALDPNALGHDLESMYCNVQCFPFMHCEIWSLEVLTADRGRNDLADRAGRPRVAMPVDPADRRTEPTIALPRASWKRQAARLAHGPCSVSSPGRVWLHGGY